jgi:putative FmdB family regulatory protein
VPRYDYGCKICNKQFESTHSYKSIVLDCILCEATGSVSKLLSVPVSLARSETPLDKGEKVGTEVIKAIESARKEITADKKEMKERKLF